MISTSSISLRSSASVSYNKLSTTCLSRKVQNKLRLHVKAQSSSNDDAPTSSDGTSGVLAAISWVAAPVVLFSEFTLKSTGCGLPAGPFGLYGAIEGISYLWVVGLVGFSIYTKATTGKGLPNGPYGLLGAAEGVSYLAILAGLVVLYFQINDFGYIPNAIPVEGGKCA